MRRALLFIVVAMVVAIATNITLTLLHFAGAF